MTAETTPSSSAARRGWLYGGLVAVAALLGVGVWLASRPADPPLEGEVEAETANVATKALARIETIRVQEGDRVRAGDVLATLSSPEIDSGQRQAQATLDSARAAQALADEGTRAEDIASLRAAWQATEATARLAAVSARRADRLFAEGVIAAQRRDEADAARRSSAETARAANQQYRKALAGPRPQARAIAAAQVRLAAAGADAARALGRETRLVAPISGIVARRLVKPGEIVSPVLPAIQVTDIDHPYVTLNLPESQYRGMAAGRVLTAQVPALGRAVRFRVSHIAAQGAFATFRADRQSRGYDVRAFEIKLHPDGAVRDLRPGMSVLFDWPQ